MTVADVDARRLATIELIESVKEIEGADAIECAVVRGWEVVVKKGEFQPGDAVCYFEVDSLLDIEDERFAFLARRGVRTDAEGRKGHVLKTVKLRGQYSQGLVLPLSEFPELAGVGIGALVVGDDVTVLLGVVKYEAPLPASLSGVARGTRPSWVPKTDEERIQNVQAILGCRDVAWEATEKLDGCLQARTRVLMADGSSREIRRVKVGDEVMGVDENGNLTTTPVLRLWDNGPTEDWLKIKGPRLGIGRGSDFFSVVCTPNHRFWNPGIDDYVKASDLNIGDTLTSVRSERALTPLQRSVLLGKILGDGSIAFTNRPSWSVNWGHTAADSEYVEWTIAALGDLAHRTTTVTSGYGSEMHRGMTSQTPWIRKAFVDFIDGNGKKIIPKSVIGELDPIALAFWYMDDGSLSHNDGQEDRAHISTDGFAYDDVLILQAALEALGLVTTLQKSRGRWSLRFNSDAAEKLFLMVAPYVPKSMQRKLPERYRGCPGWLPAGSTAKYKPMSTTVVIDSIEPWIPRTQSNHKFDIETGTHNFFANGLLVHNSSTSFYYNPDSSGVVGVCSRNLDLVESEGNTMWAMAHKYDMRSLMAALCEEHGWSKLVVQGETYGEGIQSNPLKVKGHHFAAFNVLVDGIPLARHAWPLDILEMSVPVLDLPFPETLAEALSQAESLTSRVTSGCPSEGIVWRSSTPYVKLPSRVRPDTGEEIPGKEMRGSFKVISRKYLLRHDQ